MLKSKTLWTAIVTAGASIAKLFGVNVPPETFGVLLSLMAIFLKLAVVKVNA